MARVIIESDNGRTRIEVRDDVRAEFIEPGMYAGYCKAHGIWLTDRGHFEDTCNEIANHIVWEHGEVHQS